MLLSIDNFYLNRVRMSTSIDPRMAKSHPMAGMFSSDQSHILASHIQAVAHKSLFDHKYEESSLESAFFFADVVAFLDERRPSHNLRFICRFIDASIEEMHESILPEAIFLTYKQKLDEIVETQDEKLSKVDLSFIMMLFLNYMIYLDDKTLNLLSLRFIEESKHIPLKELRDLPVKAQIHKHLIESSIYPAAMLATSLPMASMVALEHAYEIHDWGTFTLLLVDAGIENFERFLSKIFPVLMKDQKLKEKVFKSLVRVTNILASRYKNTFFATALDLWSVELGIKK